MVVSTLYRPPGQIPRLVIPSSHPLTYGRLLYENGLLLVLSCIPGHVRICGNKTADTARNFNLYDTVTYLLFQNVI